MADTKFSDLTEATSLDGTEFVPLIQGGVGKKAASRLLGSPAPVSKTNYATSISIPDGGLLSQPNRLVLTGSNRLTLLGTGRIKIFDPLRNVASVQSYEPGSIILGPGQTLRQFDRLTLVGNQRLTLLGNSRLRIWREVYRPFGYWDAILLCTADLVTTSSKVIPGWAYPFQANSLYDIELKFVATEGNANTMTFTANYTGTVTVGTLNWLGWASSSTALNTVAAVNAATAAFFAAAFSSAISAFGLVRTTTDGIFSVSVNPTGGSQATIYAGSVMKIKKLL